MLLPHDGTQDLAVQIGWGESVHDIGLARAYVGNYFPIEWQILGLSVHLSNLFDISRIAAVKLLTLFFELGTFALLIALLRIWGLQTKYALIYWLSPYFLGMSWLGYLDPHISFAVLATLVIASRWQCPAGYVAAGIPLGVGFLMKPQLIAFVGVVAVLLAAAQLVNPVTRRTNLQPALILVGPAALFCAYSVFFALSGAGLTTVGESYLPSKLADLSPGISGQLLGPWYLVALAIREPGQTLYEVAEPAILNSIGQAAALAALLVAVLLIVRNRPVVAGRELFLAFLFTGVIVPMVATHAHENHLYLASILSIPLAAVFRSRLLTWSLAGLLFLQFLNIFARYGFDFNKLSDNGMVRTVMDVYPDGSFFAGASRSPSLDSDLIQTAAALGVIGLVAVVVAYAIRATRVWEVPAANPFSGASERAPHGDRTAANKIRRW